MEISSQDFIHSKTPLKLVETYYKIQKIIGKGAFGVVYKAFELCSGRIVAIKQIPVNTENKKHVIKEIELLKNLDHPNIVKYYNYLKEENHIYIIMEYLEGSTLKQYIDENSDNINEDIARNIIKQLLNAISYLHYSCDICHRDIKPENIMFTEKKDISHIKLLDFGLSSDSFESKLKMQNCGTLTYMAPEQISNLTYSKGVDIWSVGIILYMLLNKGKNPFYNKEDSTDTLIYNINNKEIEFDLENCPISAIGRHLIYKLLDKNPSYRYSARLALNHPWITLNKFDKIPMTLYDKLVEDENIIKLKMLLFISSFMLYYKKNYLVIKNDININDNIIYKKKFIIRTDNEEISKNDNNLENYEKNVLEINKIYEEKFKEKRENMFLPRFKTSKEINKYLLKSKKSKSENKKNNEIENNNEEKINIEEIYSDKESDWGNKDKENGNENLTLKQFESINVKSRLPKKSILKKSNINISPTNLKYNNKNKKLSNEQGKTTVFNNHFKKYDEKLSNKLISFRLSIESKEKEPTAKINTQKPIKLKSIRNSNEIMNKSKSYKLLSKNSELNDNQKKIDTLFNKNSKSTKNIERIKKDKKLSSTEKVNRNIKNDIKVSYSMDIKSTKIYDSNKKKVNYKPINIKDEYDEIDNKFNCNIFSSKSKIGIKKSTYLTSIKKSKNSSLDKSQLISSKKLFQNNSILPPIQNK
jgi:serine/threonine protein kinase